MFWTLRELQKSHQTTIHSEVCLRNIFSHPRHTNGKTHLICSTLTIRLTQHTLSCSFLREMMKMCFDAYSWEKCAPSGFFCFSGRRDGRKINLNSPHHFSGVCFSLPTDEKGAAAGTTTNLSARFWQMKHEKWRLHAVVRLHRNWLRSDDASIRNVKV